MSDVVDRLANASSSKAIKVPCRAATTANITLSGEQTVDGVALVDGDRCLVKNQTIATSNGIWSVSTGSWTRAVDFDGNNDVVQGTRVYVTGGTAGIGEYIVSSANPILFDTSNITFTADPVRSGASFVVTAFGAVGDGTTNDYAAFAAAVAAAAASSTVKTVYVPHSASGYVLGSTVIIPAGVTIRGDNLWGLELSRIKPAPAFTAALFRSSGYGVTRVLRIGLMGLFLDGSATTLTPIEVNCQESIFQHLTVKNCFTYGLHIGGVGSGATQQALNNHITDNFFAGAIGATQFFDGIFVDYFSADNTIERNYIEASKDAGIRSRGYNNKITNNHIYSVDGTGGGVGAGIYTETSADNDISDNYIELIAAEGILMAGGGADVATMAATIHDNIFRNVDTGNTSNGVIEISGSDVSAVSVRGNVVRRDAATVYSTPYFAYFNGITPTLQVVSGNVWQSGLVTIAESNLANLPDLTVANRVIVGAPAPIAASGTPNLQVHALSADAAVLAARYTTDANPSRLSFAKSRSTSIGGHTVVQSGDALGEIRAHGSNGTDFVVAATISFEVDGTPGSSNDMPGRIGFKTSSDGSATPVERMRTDQAGNVIAPYSTVALTTTATNGFLYIPTSTGVPGGAPAAYTGHLPLQYDLGSSRLWIHNGTKWVGTAVFSTT